MLKAEEEESAFMLEKNQQRATERSYSESPICVNSAVSKLTIFAYLSIGFAVGLAFSAGLSFLFFNFGCLGKKSAKSRFSTSKNEQTNAKIEQQNGHLTIDTLG